MFTGINNSASNEKLSPILVDKVTISLIFKNTSNEPFPYKVVQVNKSVVFHFTRYNNQLIDIELS